MPRHLNDKATYRAAPTPTPEHVPGVGSNFVGIGLLVGLVFAGLLAVVSGPTVGEMGIGATIMFGALLLLMKEALYAYRHRGAATHEPAHPKHEPAHPKNGELDD